MSALAVDGRVDDGFGAVADAFRANFRKGIDTGAACTVYVDGHPVVDLIGGSSARGPWTKNTRSLLFSVSKGVTTICLLMAVDEGLLELDVPVATYWPEFAAAGKGDLTVRQLLAHRAGLVAPDEVLTVDDLREWRPVTEALARQAPLWEPGITYDYHAQTFGWLAGEVLRRATGQRPAQWLQARIAQPLGLRMTFGADPDELTLAPIGAPVVGADLALPSPDDTSVSARALTMSGALPGALFDGANTDAYLRNEMPGSNLVASAHDLARLYAATVGVVDGVRLLRPGTVQDARLPMSEGVRFVGEDDGHRWGTGFMLHSRRRVMAGPGSFGHDGAGGQIGFAHLELGVSLGYTTIRPGGVTDDRAEALCRALLASV